MTQIPLGGAIIGAGLEMEVFSPSHYQAMIKVIETSRTSFLKTFKFNPETHLETIAFLNHYSADESRRVFAVRKLGGVYPLGFATLGSFDIESKTCSIEAVFIQEGLEEERIEEKTEFLLLHLAFQNGWEQVTSEGGNTIVSLTMWPQVEETYEKAFGKALF